MRRPLEAAARKAAVCRRDRRVCAARRARRFRGRAAQVYVAREHFCARKSSGLLPIAGCSILLAGLQSFELSALQFIGPLAREDRPLDAPRSFVRSNRASTRSDVFPPVPLAQRVQSPQLVKSLDAQRSTVLAAIAAWRQQLRD